jgi:hypothetical protein
VQCRLAEWIAGRCAGPHRFCDGTSRRSGRRVWHQPSLADGREAREDLAGANAELEKLRANRADGETLKRLQEQQQAAYVEQGNQQRRALKIAEAHNKVLWGVWREQEESAIHVPIEAVLARMELEANVAAGELRQSSSSP